MRPHAMPSSTGSFTALIPGKHECKGLVCDRVRLVGPEALARSEHSVKGTQPRVPGAVWQTPARGPESAIATRQAPQHKTLKPKVHWAAKARVAGGSDTDHSREARAGGPATIRVSNRAKGRREVSRPAGPRGPQDTDCQRLLISGVVPPAHARNCTPSPGKPGGEVSCCASPSRRGDTRLNRRGWSSPRRPGPPYCRSGTVCLRGGPIGLRAGG